MEDQLAPVHDRHAWEALAAGAGYGAVQQSWAYGATLQARGIPVERLRLVEDGRDVGLVQLIGRRLLGGPVVFWHGLGGPAWLTPNRDAGRPVLRLLRRRFGWRRGSLLLLTPASITPEIDRARLEAAGFRRAMTGYTTARLDLEQGLETLRRALHPDWRRRLRLGPSPCVHLTWDDPRADLLTLDALSEHDALQAKARGYASLPAAVVGGAARRGGGLLATARQGTNLVASMLFLRQGRTAIYQTGWTDDTGRRTFAHHHLLWGAVERLHEEGVRWLDLGGLNGPPGVARFKLATGALPTTFAGTFA